MLNFLKFPLGVFALAGAVWLWTPSEPAKPFIGHGNPETLEKFYQRWKTSFESRAHTEVLRIGLHYAKGQSVEFNQGTGEATLNLLDGKFSLTAADLPEGKRYEAWLLNGRSGAQPDSLKLGALTADGRGLRLDAQLQAAQLADFTLGEVAVAYAGESPQSGGVVFGSPGLMQRLYYNERYWPVAGVAAAGGVQSAPQAPAFAFLLPKVAHAANTPAASTAALTNLIAAGEKIFTVETFKGNGRTCNTCHRTNHNHTIDPAFIANLPSNDPLFVAETNPALANLERPALLRQFALFQTNADGYNNPPVMRSSPHLTGISATLKFETVALGGEFQQDSDYYNEHESIAQQENRDTQALGWGQDGSPDGGALRDFAKGAITQHLTKTLNRVAGVDFRLPTDDELDALEAYMLSLGRSQDLNLAAMTFNSPIVQKGLLLFNTKNNPGQTLTNGYPAGGTPIFGTTANCNGCHMNAGAISSTTLANPTRDTGVERMRDQLFRLADPTVPYDGGFGQVLQTDCGPDFDQNCYSDGSTDPHNIRPANHTRLDRFNTPSLVEAADTAPFFHNNGILTLEETVAFYNTQAFNNSPGAFTSKGVNRQVQLDSSQVQAVALFLRAINVLENIRGSNVLDQNAINSSSGSDAERYVVFAIAETEDAVRVLQEAVINPYPDALAKLQTALQLERQALKSFGMLSSQSQNLTAAIKLKNQAHALIVTGG